MGTPQTERLALSGATIFIATALAAALFVAALMHAKSAKIFSFPDSVMEASAEDLPAFWRGGELAAAGAGADAYNPAIFREGLGPAGQGLLWLNPPHFFLAVAPLSFLPYGAAKIIWLTASVAALAGLGLLAGRRPGLTVLLLFSPAAFAHLLAYQMAPFAALAMFAGLRCAKQRPWLAAILLAALTVKPQFGLLAPVFLAAIGAWRAIALTAFVSAGLVALSVAAFGIEPWSAYLNAAGPTYAAHGAALHRDMLAVHQTLGKAGADADLRAVGQIAAILIAAAATGLAARNAPRDEAIGLTLLLTGVAAPSFWTYDWTFVAAGVLALLAARSFSRVEASLAGALWIAPLIPMGLGAGFGLSETAGATLAGAVLAIGSLGMSARPATPR